MSDDKMITNGVVGIVTSGEQTNLALRPAVDAETTAELLKESRAHAKTLRGIANREIEQGRNIMDGQRRRLGVHAQATLGRRTTARKLGRGARGRRGDLR